MLVHQTLNLTDIDILRGPTADPSFRLPPRPTLSSVLSDQLTRARCQEATITHGRWRRAVSPQ